MAEDPKTDGEDEPQAEPADEGATGGLPDEGIEGDEGRGTGEGDAGPASGSSGLGSGG